MKKILLLLPLLLVSCNDIDARSPLKWCVDNITTEKIQYTYEEVFANYEYEIVGYENPVRKDYIITVYTYPNNRDLLETRWYCEIIYKKVDREKIKKDEIYYLGKDKLYESNYN